MKKLFAILALMGSLLQGLCSQFRSMDKDRPATLQ